MHELKISVKVIANTSELVCAEKILIWRGALLRNEEVCPYETFPEGLVNIHVRTGVARKKRSSDCGEICPIFTGTRGNLRSACSHGYTEKTLRIFA